jgi:hypothetical protein
MISGRLCLRRSGALSLLVVIGLSTTIHSSQAQSETCSLPSQHAGVTFPIEKVDPDWPADCKRLSATTLQPERSAQSEQVCQNRCIATCWIVRLWQRP